jgi:multiple sugar transport system substrate-binding protein
MPEGAARYGVNRASLWQDDGFLALMKDAGPNFIEAVTTSMAEDTDPDWRPRVPQWPAVGDFMATAVQAALSARRRRNRRSPRRRPRSTR